MSAVETRFDDDDVADPLLESQLPIPTDKIIITFKDKAAAGKQVRLLKDMTRGSVRSSGFTELSNNDFLGEGDTVFFDDIGVAVISPGRSIVAPAMISALAAEDDVIEARPAYYFFAVKQQFKDNVHRTWGVEAVGAAKSRYTGRGIKVAVLDTGFDSRHPDFGGRSKIVAVDFTGSGSADDRQGHGTHCAGTVAGPTVLNERPRYGIAPDAELFVGKVLNDEGIGEENNILKGIRWAIASKCDVISMSLGRTVRRGERWSPFYERLGKLALSKGCLIIAAAGNDSSRASGYVAPVSQPANSPSFMAVAALDQRLAVAYFSNGTINRDGGGVDIAAPGVNIFSAAPQPRNYRTLGGTSMACPHVAGVAALWAESDPALRGQALWDALISAAQPLKRLKRDVGAGLVKAP